MTKYNIETSDLNELQIADFERLRKLTKYGAHHADLTVRKDAIDHHFEADWIYSAKIERMDDHKPDNIPKAACAHLGDRNALASGLVRKK